LSLDELKIFLDDRGDLTGYDTGTGRLAGRDAVYNLDVAGDTTVMMNYALNHGSGSGDMAVLIPDALFAAAAGDPFVYLYSSFGRTAGGNAGFEEWAGLPKSDVSALASLAGRVYFDANANGLSEATDAGLAGVYVTLTGTDDLGRAVSLTAVTDAAGNYRFAGLRPGTYTLTETQPHDYADGADSVGSLGGVLGNDTFTNIVLRANQNGTGYDFGELLMVNNT